MNYPEKPDSESENISTSENVSTPSMATEKTSSAETTRAKAETTRANLHPSCPPSKKPASTSPSQPTLSPKHSATSTTAQPYRGQHWHYRIDEHGWLWLTFDRQGTSVNSLDQAAFEELDRVLDQINTVMPQGVVIQSGKKKGFIAGADIRQFVHLTDQDAALALVEQAKQVFDKLEALPMPTIALIRGFCLGGGLELALACDYRLAEDSSGTLIGLPEVKLGLIPGWGGTVRLPRLIGAVEAMKMILPGAVYPARKAKRVGIVDEALPPRSLDAAVRYYLTQRPRRHEPQSWHRYTNHRWIRPLLAKQFIKRLEQQHVNPHHYPAPYAAVNNWRVYGVGAEAMLQESRAIAQLLLTDTSRHCVQLFFWQEQLKGLAKGISLGKGAPFDHVRVHVLGAGTMGGDIAAWCAYKGFVVTLQDTNPSAIAGAIARATQLFQKKFRGQPHLIQSALDRLQPDMGSAICHADLIIEAVSEDLSLKQKIFKQIDAKARPDALLATNTSSIPIESMASVLSDPTRLVGVHFFNPVAKMLLVEVVGSDQTNPACLDQAKAWIGRLGRLPLPVASQPGFLVNRILMPYLMEAVQLLEEGLPASMIDQAAVQFGMPMGPLRLMDQVGLDVCLSVAEKLAPHYGGELPQRLVKLVEDKGYYGVKSGQGFYRYAKGKLVAATSNGVTSPTVDLETITDRLILRQVNEAVACLADRIITEPNWLDAAMVFGTGFAPFRAGPLHYAKHVGYAKLFDRLTVLAKQYGERFKPHPYWETLMGQAGPGASMPSSTAAAESTAIEKETSG